MIEDMDEEKSLFKKIEKKKIYIYGAGFIGRLLLKRIRSAGVQFEKLFFVETGCSEGKRVNGVSVLSPDQISGGSSSAVIIATDPKYHKAVIGELRRRNIIAECYFISQTLREVLEEKHMRSKSEPGIEGQIDAFMMVSDNYKASGAFLCAVEMCEWLKKAGLNMLLVLPEYGEGEDLLEERDVSYIYVKSANWCVRIGEETDELPDNHTAVEKLIDLIHRHRVRLIHNNTSYTYVGALAARETNIPYIWHLRENVNAQGMKFINKEYSESLIRSADRVICVSRFLRSSYDFLSDENSIVIYDGVRKPAISKQNRTRFEDDEITIINVGVITKRKAQEDIVKACILLKKYGLRFQCLFLGDFEDAYKRKLDRIIEGNGLRGNINFVGVKSNVWDYLDQADIAVVSSIAEPFGRCTVEALQSGCLTIGADSGATKEIIVNGENGYLYESGNEKMLADIILNATNDLDTSSLIMQKGIRDGGEYSLKRNTTQVLEIYKTIFQKSGYLTGQIN